MKYTLRMRDDSGSTDYRAIEAADLDAAIICAQEAAPDWAMDGDWGPAER